MGVGVTFFVIRYFSPKNPLIVCYALEDFGEGAAEGFGPLSISLWVFFFSFDFICKDCFELTFLSRR